jgi:hypothetical protein
MLFLLQMKIFKSLKGQNMDEGLFRGYFVKMYKSLVKMEEQFLEMMPESESQAFVKEDEIS